MQKIILELFQGHLYLASSDKVVFEKSMSALSILLKRRKRRKRVVLKNRCEIFRDNNHQSLYKNIKLYNDIDWNPGPVYVNESTEYCYVQGRKKNNSCTPCVPISLGCTKHSTCESNVSCPRTQCSVPGQGSNPH